jgi:vancomycin resistance protein YoaR
VKRAMQEFAVPAMSGPVSLQVGQRKLTIQPELVGRHLAMQPDSKSRLQPKLDAKGLTASLFDRLKGFASKARDASFTFRGGRPTVIPSRTGLEVNPNDLGAAVLTALPKTGADRVAAVKLKVTTPDVTTEEANALRIRERMSTFTTRYPVVPYRVNNIGRAAQLINGSLVLPGETWSLNRTIGERTAANGFVEGYVIDDGRFTKELGGGTSQVATTTFNAVFFAGLKDVEHHPHSLYISRYPAGREATVAWGAKDLRFYNDSGHGVLIQASHSPGQITVSFWGTKKYDEVRSISSGRYNIRPWKTIHSTEKNCENQAPVSGFDIDVTRVFVDGGREVKRETFHTSYRPTDKIVCRSSP